MLSTAIRHDLAALAAAGIRRLVADVASSDQPIRDIEVDDSATVRIVRVVRIAIDVGKASCFVGVVLSYGCLIW